MDKQILMIEDDPEIAELVELHLADLGFRTERVSDGETGLRTALEGNHELVILDVMLPRMDGLEVCKRLREKKKGLPILMLTAKSEEVDTVLGLELGADDYITKPFSIRELMARVKAIVRRVHALKAEEASGVGKGKIEHERLAIDIEMRRVTFSGNEVELTAKEFDLLTFLATHPGRPYSREQLLNLVWGYTFTGYEHTVNSHINRLRAKIEADPSHPAFIITVWGVGYRFADREAR